MRFLFQAEDGIRDHCVTGVQTCALPILNDSTGAAHLVMVPGNPRMLFAGMWQFVRRPWELVSGGAGSGVYRSKDGGLTWERLTPGLPSGVTGKDRKSTRLNSSHTVIS